VVRVAVHQVRVSGSIGNVERVVRRPSDSSRRQAVADSRLRVQDVRADGLRSHAECLTGLLIGKMVHANEKKERLNARVSLVRAHDGAVGGRRRRMRDRDGSSQTALKPGRRRTGSRSDASGDVRGRGRLNECPRGKVTGLRCSTHRHAASTVRPTAHSRRKLDRSADRTSQPLPYSIA
jgi:hypothetical protein